MYLLQATLLACFTSYTCESSVIGFSPRSEKSTNVMSRDMKSTRNSIARGNLHTCTTYRRLPFSSANTVGACLRPGADTLTSLVATGMCSGLVDESIVGEVDVSGLIHPRYESGGRWEASGWELGVSRLTEGGGGAWKARKVACGGWGEMRGGQSCVGRTPNPRRRKTPWGSAQ